MKFKRLLYDLNRSCENIFGPMPVRRNRNDAISISIRKCESTHSSSNFDDIPSWSVSSTPVPTGKETEEDFEDDKSKGTDDDTVKVDSDETAIDGEGLLPIDISVTSFSEQMIRQMIGCEVYVGQLGYGHVLGYLGQKASFTSSGTTASSSYSVYNLKLDGERRAPRINSNAIEGDCSKTRGAAGCVSIFKVQMQDGRVIALPICPYIDLPAINTYTEGRNDHHSLDQNHLHDQQDLCTDEYEHEYDHYCGHDEGEGEDEDEDECKGEGEGEGKGEGEGEGEGKGKASPMPKHSHDDDRMCSHRHLTTSSYGSRNSRSNSYSNGNSNGNGNSGSSSIDSRIPSRIPSGITVQIVYKIH